MTLEELKRIVNQVKERNGWDFSRIRSERDSVPWDYLEKVRPYLNSNSRVLDIGTGGGEKFLSLARRFETGVGIDCDAAMIQVAQANTPSQLAGKVSFVIMDGRDLKFPDYSFDVVLNRHSKVFPHQVLRVLRPGGVFITQQVGRLNTKNLCEVFGCQPGGEYEPDAFQEADVWVDEFVSRGCSIIDRTEYNVRYWFADIESLIFWLKAIPLPRDFDIENHWRDVNRIVSEFTTPRGIETNEHRLLFVVKVPERS